MSQMTTPSGLLQGGEAWCYGEEAKSDHACLLLPLTGETQSHPRKKKKVAFSFPHVLLPSFSFTVLTVHGVLSSLSKHFK